MTPQSAKPRILHLYKDYYPPTLGGIETTINLMANGTSDQYDITVLVNTSSPTPIHETIDHINIIRIPQITRIASAPISPQYITALRKHAPHADLIHIHHPNPTSDLALFITRPRQPIIMTYHSDIIRQKKALALYKPLQNWTLNRTSLIMPTSPNYQQSSPHLRPYQHKCHVLPLGIPTRQYEPTPTILQQAAQIRHQYQSQPIILFVGRLRYYKGLQYLLQAIPQLNTLTPDTTPQILLAGTGTEETSLRQQTRELNIQNQVHFLGDITDPQKIAHYHAATLFCLPSHLRSEAYGLSQIEAMASGLPVISCNIPTGVPYVNTHNKTGLTVPPQDPSALAQAIAQLINNPTQRQTLAQNAKTKAQTQFDTTTMCQNLKQIYQAQLNRQHPTPD